MKTENESLSEKIERYEEPINRAKIEHIVRQAHWKDYEDASPYCNGCVKMAILETIRLLKEELFCNNSVLDDLDEDWIIEKIDKLAGNKLI